MGFNVRQIAAEIARIKWVKIAEEFKMFIHVINKSSQHEYNRHDREREKSLPVISHYCERCTFSRKYKTK